MATSARNFRNLLAGAVLALSPTLMAQTMTKEAPSEKIWTKANITAASAFITRGITVTKGAVLQPSVWLFHPSGLGAGVWGSFKMNDDPQEPGLDQDRNEVTKMDFYLSYNLPTPDALSINVIYAQYYMPQFEEQNAVSKDTITTIALKTPLNPFVSVAYGVGGNIKEDIYAEIGAKEKLFVSGKQDVHMGVVWAYRDWNVNDTELESGETVEIREDGWSHGEITLGYRYDQISIDGHYLVELNEDVQRIATATQFYGSVGYGTVF